MERTLGFNTLDITHSNRRSNSLPGTMKLWQRRIQNHHQLAHLNSRLLADTGINEAQCYAGLNEPFWH